MAQHVLSAGKTSRVLTGYKFNPSRRVRPGSSGKPPQVMVCLYICRLLFPLNPSLLGLQRQLRHSQQGAAPGNGRGDGRGWMPSLQRGGRLPPKFPLKGWVACCLVGLSREVPAQKSQTLRTYRETPSKQMSGSAFTRRFMGNYK